MTLCLVTSRQRLCPDGSAARARACVVEQGRLAVQAGIDLVQVREHDLPASEIAALVRALVALSRGSATRIVVNERLDIALACGADGVHLRSDSMPANRIREATPPGFLVGRSVHSVEEARSAGPVDYLIAGTMFATESKPEKIGTDLLGVDGLTAIVRATPAPVLAVGGLTLERVSTVMRTGAAGLAAIGLFLGPPGPAMNDRVAPLEVLVHEIRARV